jgi:hypothetical protein
MDTATKGEALTIEMASDANLPATFKPTKEPAPFAPTPIGKITSAIAAVMREVDIVAKRGENKFHGYKYAKMEHVLQRITPLLGKHSLVVFQNEIGRSLFDGDQVIAVTYEFTVAHDSGEIWPEKLRQTGVSRCRNSKDGWDDKSLNKCHTSARKYFLLSLFQIPTGEEDDADHGDNDAPRSRGKVAKDAGPHCITVKGSGTKGWTHEFLAAIRKADTLKLIDEWVQANQWNLDNLERADPGNHRAATEAVARRLKELRQDERKPLPPVVAPKDGTRKASDYAMQARMTIELPNWPQRGTA